MAGELERIRTTLASKWTSREFEDIKSKLKKEVRGIWDSVDSDYKLRVQLSNAVKEKISEAYKKCLLQKQDKSAADCLKSAAYDNKLHELMRGYYYK